MDEVCVNVRKEPFLQEVNDEDLPWEANKSKENLLAIEIKIAQIVMNKLVYLVLSILELSKKVMYEFWHDYVKRKYGSKIMLHG